MKTYQVTIDKDGTQFWYFNGQLHREDGPAIERTNGTREWWINGQLHREDGPAIERLNGTRSWWINGRRHREDGHAIERPNGIREWWINGQKLTETEFNERTKSTCDGRIVEINGRKYRLQLI